MVFRSEEFSRAFSTRLFGDGGEVKFADTAVNGTDILGVPPGLDTTAVTGITAKGVSTVTVG